MDFQAFKLTGRVVALALCICWLGILFSCSSDKSKGEEPQIQPDLTAIKERMKATELAFEYEQFVNRMWRELNLLSDSLTDLQINNEVRTPKNRKERMASIQKNLKELETRLKEAERNAVFNERDRQEIKELRDAIKRKDATIKKLKKENSDLWNENSELIKRLEEKEVELKGKEVELVLKDRNLNEKERQLYSQRRSSAGELERMGDYLRKVVIAMGAYKGSGVYESYKASQIKLLEISIYCYNQANRSYSSQSLTNKIRRTQFGLERYRDTKDLSELDF